MIRKVKKLNVTYNGRKVGNLAEVDNTAVAFQYDEEWLKCGFPISPFSLPLTREVFVNKKNTFDGLYGVFQDSLPDGWGELLMRRMLLKKGVNPNKLSPLTKLAVISGNGLGALQYEPSQNTAQDEPDFDLDAVAEEAKILLNNESAGVDFDKIYHLGGSSGGARPKAHIKEGNEYWIVKFPCRLDPQNVGEKEYNANLTARQCGIHVNECKLFPSRLCSGYFGAKRFDRAGEQRTHILSLSSLLETTHRVPNLDYIHLFQVVAQICFHKDDIYEAFKRMCFNVFYGNKDDHGKNFSFLFDESFGSYRLSPAYDLTKTVNKAEHEMTVNGAGNPTQKDLLEVAKIMNLPAQECTDIIKKIRAITARKEEAGGRNNRQRV